MTQEGKELLLKDLCARLPYGVKCKWEHEHAGKTYVGGGVLCDIDHVKTSNGYRYWDCYFEDEGDDIPIELVKPYLRPLSSMTKEERQEMEKVIGSNPIEPFGTLTDTCDNLVRSCAYGSYLMLHYLYSHHFDVINLIEKGLALEAKKEMYDIKEK